MEEEIRELLKRLTSTPEGRGSLAARRKNLFSQINEIVFYGKGGYDFDTVYNLPIWLRQFIYHEIGDAYKAEAEIQSGKGQSRASSEGRPEPNEAVMQTLRRQSTFSIQNPNKY